MVADDICCFLFPISSTPRKFATGDGCGKWPSADAIINFHGEVGEGSRVYYSGIAIRLVEQGP